MPKKKKAKGLLPSLNYRRQVYVGIRADGSRRYESFTGETAAEAEALASAFRVRVRQLHRMGVAVEDIPRDDVPVKPRTGPTLGEAMDAFIDTCRTQDYSPSTIPGYISIRKNSFPQLIDKPIRQITMPDVQAAVNARAIDHAIKTVRNDFFFLKKVMAIYAPELDLSKVTIAKRKKRKKHVFKQTWDADILQYARKNEDADFYLYCSFIISAGLRPSEAYALTWDDLSAQPITMISDGKAYMIGEIDVSRAEVRDEFGNYRTKTNKTEAGTRKITVDWSFFEDVYSVKPRRPGEKIFSKKPNGLTKAWRRTREALNLPENMRYYDLRHFYATAVATSGASEDELKARMGHSTSAFSHDVYVELFEDRQTAINAALSNTSKRLYAARME